MYNNNLVTKPICIVFYVMLANITWKEHNDHTPHHEIAGSKMGPYYKYRLQFVQQNIQTQSTEQNW